MKDLARKIRETASPESQIVATVTPQLIHQLSFSHLAELLELPDKPNSRLQKYRLTEKGKAMEGSHRQ